PLTVRSIVLSWCFSTCDREACGNETGMRPVAMKLAVVSTMVSSTSMISTNGITLIVSNGFSSMSDLPLQQEDADFPQQAIVDDDRDRGEDKPRRGRLQGQRQSDHDPAGIDRCVEAEGVKRQHDPEDGAQETDIRRVGRDRRHDDEAPRQLKL